MTPQEKFEQFIQDNQITMTYKFVPFSISRNAKEDEKTINWKVTMKSPSGQLTVDYQKGIGHLPYPSLYTFNNLSKYQKSVIQENIDIAVETGVARQLIIKGDKINVGIKNEPFPNPTLQEVLQSVVLDSEVKNYVSFESWAKEYGYNSDSISAEKIYKKCQKNAEGLAKVLNGVKNIDLVRDMIYEIENQPTPKKIKP